MTISSYFSATTVDEALAALAEGARPIAGGTDLVVGARQGKAPLPDRLVSLRQIEQLHVLEHDAAKTTIGAGVTHAALVADAEVRERLTALADASSIVGSHATQHVGTLGGNIMNASPAMETAGPLLCLDAEVLLVSADGVRQLRLDELLAGPGRTVARPGELLHTIEIPRPAPGTGSAYVRLQYRQQMEVAVVGAAARITLDGDRIHEARIALTAVAPTIFRVPEAEQTLQGTEGTREQLHAAAAVAAAAGRPIADLRGSAEYRQAMTAVITRRALSVALDRARGIAVPIPASTTVHPPNEGGSR